MNRRWLYSMLGLLIGACSAYGLILLDRVA